MLYTLSRYLLALLLLVSAITHLVLWQEGYKAAPVAELFILSFITGSLIAYVLLFTENKVVLSSAALFMLAMFSAFILSRTTGVPTLEGLFKDSGYFSGTLPIYSVSSGTLSLVSEALGFILAVAMLIKQKSNKSKVASTTDI